MRRTSLLPSASSSSEPGLSGGWHPANHNNSIIKSFHFTLDDNMGGFLLGILSCVHDQSIGVVAMEKFSTHDVVVSITELSNDTIDNTRSIDALVSTIDRLYGNCQCHHDEYEEEE